MLNNFSIRLKISTTKIIYKININNSNLNFNIHLEFKNFTYDLFEISSITK